MPPIITSAAVEIELASGVWTNMVSATPAQNYFIPGSLQWHRGVGENRVMQTGSMAFALDNADETWTPGNTASAQFNKLVRGIGVRYSTTFGAVQRFHFRGVITDIEYVFPEVAPGDMRVEITCEGQTSLLAKYEDYSMPVVTDFDVDDIAASIMLAVGSSHYSFADSDQVIRYGWPRSNPLSDLVAVHASDPKQLLFEDGQGRARSTNLVPTAYASPDHTWGSTTAPIGEISPDWRHESQFARQVVDVTTPALSSGNAVLYRHPLNLETGVTEYLEPGAQRKITVTLDRIPVLVSTIFNQTIYGFIDSGDDLGQSMTAAQTSCITSSNIQSPTTFQVGDQIIIDQELMEVTAWAPWPFGQALIVTRGLSAGFTQPHIYSPLAPKPILYRPKVVTSTFLGTLLVALTPSMTTVTPTTPPGGVATVYFPSMLIKIDGEIMTVVSAGTTTIVVTRGTEGSVAASHAIGAQVFKYTNEYPEDVFDASYIRSSTFPTGNPALEDDIVGVGLYAGGQHISVSGRKASAVFRNSAVAGRYLADLVIGGIALEVDDRVTSIAYSKAIPYIVGIPDGPTLSLPYGVSDIQVAKGLAIGSLMAGRVPTPWLPISFQVASSSDAADLLGAEIGDLVRYTGTGTNREKIDEWYRIMSIGGNLPDDDYIRLDFLLAPAHLWRNPAKAYYSDFGWQQSDASVGLGEFQVKGVGSAGWTNDSAWSTFQDPASVTAPNQARALGAGGSNVIAGHDVGGADQVIGFSVGGMTSGQNSYGATTGGVGGAFRSNNTLTQRWELRFNPTQSLIYLYNTTDGLVGTPYAWTPTGTGELEVRAMANRIRVYLNALPEPIIDVTSTRFQTNTWAGPRINRTILSGGGVTPYFTDWYAQAL